MKRKLLTAAFLVITVLTSVCASSKKNAKSEDKKKNFTGWIDTSEKEIKNSMGIINLKVKPALGSFNISVINSLDKSVPVLSTANEYTSSSLYLKTNKKIYKLIADNNVKTRVSKKDNEIAVFYEIAKVASVTLNFKFEKSSPESDYDMLKISAKVTNRGKKKGNFALKEILDTVLGEKGYNHFYDFDNVPVKNEVLYRNFKDIKWIYSKNNSAEMQVIFAGADATLPQIVSLANFSTLDKNSWEPDMISYRTFDTVLSYNNSAVGIIWPEVELLPEKSSTFVYYLAFAADEQPAKGSQFIADYEANSKKKAEEKVNADVKTEVKKDNPVKENLPSKKENVKEIEESALKSQEKNTLKDDFEFDTPVNQKKDPNVKKSELESKYTQADIQIILDRISELEKEGSSASKEEISQLNKELDDMLEDLRN